MKHLKDKIASRKRGMKRFNNLVEYFVMFLYL